MFRRSETKAVSSLGILRFPRGMRSGPQPGNVQSKSAARPGAKMGGKLRPALCWRLIAGGYAVIFLPIGQRKPCVDRRAGPAAPTVGRFLSR